MCSRLLSVSAARSLVLIVGLSACSNQETASQDSEPATGSTSTTEGTSGPGPDSSTTTATETGSPPDTTGTTGTDTDSTNGSTGGPQSCDDDPPEDLLPVTWNVMDGPTPEGTNVVLGDGSDEQAALQAILDAAAEDDVVFFPNPPMFYGIGAPLTITTSLEVRGAGFGEGSVRAGTAEFEGPEFHALGSLPQMLLVQADNVTVRGLGFVGPGRPVPAVTERDEHGIHAFGALGDRVRGLTVVENDLRSFIGEAIRVRWADGYIIRDNRSTELGYAGVLVQNSSHGLLTGNRVIDVVGTAVTDDDPPIVNAYGVTITGVGTPQNPICDHTIMSDNYVENIPGWTGVMDHGGEFTLMMDNEAVGCDFGLALTGPGNDCLVINNVNESSPRQGFWNIGRPRVGLIGNVFVAASGFSLSGADMVVTDNRSVDGLGDQISHNGAYGQLTAYEARNEWGNWTQWNDADAGTPSVWLSDATTPAVPEGLVVTACDDQRTFAWEYDPAVAHSAFAIEASEDGVAWQPLAFRPPHDGTWDFDTDAHPDWVPLDTLSYKTTSDAPVFRIRALHGDAVSAWSDPVSVD